MMILMDLAQSKRITAPDFGKLGRKAVKKAVQAELSLRTSTLIGIQEGGDQTIHPRGSVGDGQQVYPAGVDLCLQSGYDGTNLRGQFQPIPWAQQMSVPLISGPQHDQYIDKSTHWPASVAEFDIYSEHSAAAEQSGNASGKNPSPESVQESSANIFELWSRPVLQSTDVDGELSRDATFPIPATYYCGEGIAFSPSVSSMASAMSRHSSQVQEYHGFYSKSNTSHPNQQVWPSESDMSFTY